MTYKPQEDIAHIRSMMEKSSRFISLSGLSGIVAGVLALFGAMIALYLMHIQNVDYIAYARAPYSSALLQQLILLAVALFVLSVGAGIYFTVRKSRKIGLPIWTTTTKHLLLHLAIPLIAGACFCTALILHHQLVYVAPATLVFYGLALINASKYTYSDVFYLGSCEVILGLLAMFLLGYGMIFWGVGFGLLHIIYGSLLAKKHQ